jgi:hypothetical protein
MRSLGGFRASGVPDRRSGASVKNLIAAFVASIPGMVAGIVLWTVLATCLLLVYWIGYVFLFLGFLCGPGKWSLNWFTPPSASVQEATSHWAMLLTALAFTFGEVLAGAAGAFLGGATGVAGMRLFTWVRRGRRQE